MKQVPIMVTTPQGDPEVQIGEAFFTDDGKLAFHVCHNERCLGVVIGLTSKTGTAVIHYEPDEAMKIAEALTAMARRALG